MKLKKVWKNQKEVSGATEELRMGASHASSVRNASGEPFSRGGSCGVRILSLAKTESVRTTRKSNAEKGEGA